MLGIFQGPNGRDRASVKSSAREAHVEEIIPTPPSESAEFALTSESNMLSPTVGTNSLKVQKRQSSFNRAVGTIREGFSRLTNSYVREQHQIYRQRAERELGSSVGRHAYDTSIEGLLEWIRRERLVRIPNKGGSWDKVLIAAQYFAEQVHHLNKHVSTFTEEADSAANLVFGQCLILLELGHENADALEKAFELFYQFGLELSPLLAKGEIFGQTQSIMDGIGKAFADLLQIVTGVSITFYQAVHSDRAVTKLDIFATFSSSIENFRHRVRRCSHEMWKYVLGRYHQDACNIEELQEWLMPKDTILEFLASDHIKLAPVRNDFTCRWFQSHLSGFLKSSKDVLLVEGRPGTGKSVLAGWVVDRLHRPIGRKHVSTISFSYDPSIAGQSSTNALLKTLLNQLLSQRIGDVDLFNAVNETFLESSYRTSAADLESRLWKSLTKALHSISHHSDDTLAIVIDGVVDHHDMKVACKKLHDLAHKNHAVKIIQFSQHHEKIDSSVHVHLNAETLSDDIRTIVRQALFGHDQMKNREIGEQEGLVEQIVEAAHGNILWAYLTCKKIQRQTNKAEFDGTLKSVCAGSKDPVEAAKSLYKMTTLDNYHRELLILLCSVARPMQVEELDTLCRIGDKVENKTTIQSLLSKVSAFIVQTEGLVAIRHEDIRKALHEYKEDTVLAHGIKNAEYNMAVRLLTYIKDHLRDDCEPTLTGLERKQAESRLREHSLLEYSVRYWAYHFKRSSHYKPKGDLEITDQLRDAFSSSVLFCMLEQACWNAQQYSHEALVFHDLAYRLRKKIFTDIKQQKSVLQSSLACALLCELSQNDHTHAVEWYGLASRLSKNVIGIQANLTITCCQTLIRISETLLTKKRTTVMNYREEVLIILVESYKIRYGHTSKEVLEIYKKLQELYIYIEEEKKVAEIIEIIRKITVEIHGHHSQEAERISRSASVMLRKHQHAEDIETNKGFLFRGYLGLESREELTIVHVEELLKLAIVLIGRKEYVQAEEIYIELWLKLTEHCAGRHVCEWHEKKITVMIKYAEFLMEQKRTSEASAIFVAIWSEYEHHEFSMFEAIILILKKVAVNLKTLGLLTLSLSIFRKCWSFYKNSHRESHSEFIQIEEYISVVSTEISRKTTETTTTTTSETIIREVFESSMSSETTIVTKKTVELCRSLTDLYIKDSRYHEAVTCIKKLLIKSWSSFFSESLELITLAEHHRTECVSLVLQLAECYIKQKRYEKAEFVYMRLYRAYRKQFGIEHAEVVQYRKTLIEFYERHELFVKQISFYQELLIDYREHKSYHLMVEVLYKLGAICRRHSTNYGYWLEYYLEIIAHLNKGQDLCHHDAFDALLIVTRHYYQTLRFSESLVYFRSIFATFFKHGLTWEFFKQTTEVKVLIEQYFRSIEESKLEFKMHIEIVKKLRESCYKYYGATSELTIIVTETLAEVCERHEEYKHEAIHYFELITSHESSVSVEITKRVEKRLHSLYVEQVTKKSSTTTTVSKEMTEKATKLVYKRYLKIREEHDCTHEESLTVLKELVLLYHEAKQIELAMKELKLSVISIVKESSSARKMIEAASVIAGIYISIGLKEQAITIIRELKLQIIYKHSEGSAKFGFDVTKVGRVCFAFIAAFEYHVRAIWTVSIAMYMADLIAEYTFYQKLMIHLKEKNALLEVFRCGSKIRQIVCRTHREEDYAIVERRVVAYFSEQEVNVVKSSTKASIKVLVALLLKYFSERGVTKDNWTALAGYAAVLRLEQLLTQRKHQEALELTKCTFEFLMAHEGLDDPTEITLGFQLCLMMAGRTKNNTRPSDVNLQRGMMDLSRIILSEVIKICKSPAFKISLIHCQLSELNELVELLGEQKEYDNLEWLLRLLWNSREQQKHWPKDTSLQLGKRLSQVMFIKGDINGAISLCENIVYNVRRVHGLRHHFTLTFHALLATMYVSRAMFYRDAAQKDNTANKKQAEMMAKVYFKKAIQVHEDVLKLIVSAEDLDDSDCDDDESEAVDILSQFGSVHTHFHQTGFSWNSREQEIEYVSKHIRRLLLAIQRYGGFPKARNDYEKLMHKVHQQYKDEPLFKLSEGQVLASKWKVDGHGNGNAEGDIKEDGFRAPEHWWIATPEAAVVATTNGNKDTIVTNGA